MSTTRALVTGGSGFLGRPLVQALAHEYDIVDSIDLVPHEHRVPGCTMVADARLALAVLERYDAVFHLAAAVGGRLALETEPLVVAGNLALDVAFFDYVARTRPTHATYLSSSAVYGCEPSRDGGLLAEAAVDAAKSSAFARPDGIYGWVKLTGEMVAAELRQRDGLHVTCVRPFTVYGPGQSELYPVPAFVSRAVRRDDPMTVWGSGHQVRDFVHVDDAVAAIVAAHRQRVEPAINICTGVATEFGAIARFAAAAAGYEPTIVADASKPAGVAHRVGDPTLLHRWYAPTVAVANGIRALVDGCATRVSSDAAERR